MEFFEIALEVLGHAGESDGPMVAPNSPGT